MARAFILLLLNRDDAGAVAESLEILESEAASGKIDRDLLDLFIDAKVYEQGILQRTVVVEFDSLATAQKVHDGPGYQEALRVLGDSVERDFRICEGA